MSQGFAKGGAGGVTSVNGQVGAVNLTTTDIPQGTNLYYTDALARAAISETVTGLDYNCTTGVLSLTAGYVIPTTTQESNWGSAYSAMHTQNTDTGTNAASFAITGVNGLIVGQDVAGGNPNAAGVIKLFSAGDNAFYSTFTAASQSANATYTLPTAMPASSGYALLCTDTGVMSWSAIADVDTLHSVTTRGSSTTNGISVGDFQTGYHGRDGIIRLIKSGTPDYTVDLIPGAMSTSYSLYLPTALPAATYFLKVASSGIMTYDSATYLTAETDTLSTVAGRGATT